MHLADRIGLAEREAMDVHGIERVGFRVLPNGLTVQEYRKEDGTLGVKQVFLHKKDEGSKPHGVALWFEFDDGTTVDIHEHIISVA